MAGKVAIISAGVASGIARAVNYAKAGGKIVAGYYPADPHDVQTTLDEVKAAGGECIDLPLMVETELNVMTWRQPAVNTFGRLDIVVARAGILRESKIEEMSDDAWNDMLSVDFSGVMRIFHAGSRHIKGEGAMIAISSIAGGVYGRAQHAHYAAAKSGILGIVTNSRIKWH